MFLGIKTEILEKKNCSKSPEKDPLQFLNVYVQIHCSREAAALQWFKENYWEVYNTFIWVGLDKEYRRKKIFGILFFVQKIVHTALLR